MKYYRIASIWSMADILFCCVRHTCFIIKLCNPIQDAYSSVLDKALYWQIHIKSQSKLLPCAASPAGLGGKWEAAWSSNTWNSTPGVSPQIVSATAQMWSREQHSRQILRLLQGQIFELFYAIALSWTNITCRLFIALESLACQEHNFRSPPYFTSFDPSKTFAM